MRRIITEFTREKNVQVIVAIFRKVDTSKFKIQIYFQGEFQGRYARDIQTIRKKRNGIQKIK